MASMAATERQEVRGEVARGLDDYYADRGESPGIWAGSGSAGLGLVGVVDDGDRSGRPAARAAEPERTRRLPAHPQRADDAPRPRSGSAAALSTRCSAPTGRSRSPATSSASA